MSKRFVFVLVMMVLALLGLSACTPCDMVAPGLVSPDWREILSGDLIWNYTDSCEPEHFEIELAKDNSFSVIEHTEIVSGGSTSWTPTGLDPAEQYFWRVRAEDEGIYGPWSTELRSFFTGPTCTAAQLVEPVLTLPDFGAIYDNDYDSLEWNWPLYGTCIPESYRVEVSPGSPAFTDTTYNGATGTPGTRWGFGSTPPAATQFYWRITPFSDGVWGPTSMHKMFWTAPACSAASLVQPVQETPLANDLVNSVNPILTWSYPDTSCTPEGQHIWISDMPDMSSIVFDGNSPNLASRAMIIDPPLDDCTEYYWQMAMVSEGVEGPPTTPRRFFIDASGMCGCASGLTTIPVQTNPDSYEILPDTDAPLRWYNPGGCFPDGAAVQLATDYDFADMVETTFPGMFVDGYDPPGLLPATQYRWKAAYYVEDSGSPVIGDYSGPRSFFTGPECTSLAEVAAPIRLSPADGAVINDNFAALKYTPGSPGCIPDGYLLELHKMADFSDPNLLTEYSSPATTVLTDPLDDCTTYYWSVTAVQDGGYGLESDHGSFSVDIDGSCSPGGVPGTAKSNNFCRASIYANSDGLATHVIGDRVLAIARDPYSNYLLYNILDQETGEPYKYEIHCWSYLYYFDMEGPIDWLPVVVPPEPVVEEEEMVCALDLGYEDCKAAGGEYDRKKEACYCP